MSQVKTEEFRERKFRAAGCCKETEHKDDSWCKESVDEKRQDRERRDTEKLHRNPHKRERRLWNSRGSLLDEMQEQKLLHIEKNSFWFLYGMLFVAVIVQVSMGGRLREAGAEMICFFAVSVFLVFSCLRQGIWDRRLRADWKTNLRVSCISAFIVALCSFLGIPRRNLPANMFIGVTIICVVITFTVTFAVLGICSHFYRKRKEALENGEVEEDA